MVTYDDKLLALRIHDRKVVTLISTVHSTKPVETGKKNWQTKLDIIRLDIMHQYNTYMGGVDTNDQLLKYSAYSRRCSKWWKKSRLSSPQCCDGERVCFV